MKKILLGLMLGMMLVCFIGLTSAGSEQVLNMSIVDGLFDDSVIESGVWMNGTWNGAWWSNPWKYVKGDILTKNTLPSDLEDEMYYTRYFEDPVIETPSKPDGSTCLVQWVCENGAWIKTDYVNWHIPYNCEKDKMIYNSYSNKMVKSQYNERNCEHSKNYWKKVIPGEKCFVLNDNGIGLKSKPTTACQSETIVLNEPKSTEKIDIIIEKPKPKSLWQRIISWFK